jgi:hypothetical protein
MNHLGARSYAEGMEVGPADANGRYEHDGKVYRLDERESHRWRVFDDGVHIGTVIEMSRTPDAGVLYTIEVADGRGPETQSTDDWQRAIETLIGLATF